MSKETIVKQLQVEIDGLSSFVEAERPEVAQLEERRTSLAAAEKELADLIAARDALVCGVAPVEVTPAKRQRVTVSVSDNGDVYDAVCGFGEEGATTAEVVEAASPIEKSIVDAALARLLRGEKIRREGKRASTRWFAVGVQSDAAKAAE